VQNERPTEGDSAKTSDSFATIALWQACSSEAPTQSSASQPPRLSSNNLPLLSTQLPLQGGVKIGTNGRTLSFVLTSEGIEKMELKSGLPAGKKQKELNS